MFAKLQSSLFHKCPRCLEGDMYPDMNPYHLKETSHMHSHCPKCERNVGRGGGYCCGAMYVRYAFAVASSVAVFIADYLFFWERGTLFFIVFLSVVLALCAPYTFRTSRAIWLNFFNKFNPELRKKVLEGKDLKMEV